MTTEHPTDPFQDLKNTLFLLDGIHGNLASEREFLTTLTTQMSTAFKQFEKHLGKFESQSKETRHQIQEIIHHEAQQAAGIIATEACEQFSKTVLWKTDEAIKGIQEMSSEATNHLYKVQETLGLFSKRLIGSMVVVALISGLIGGGISGGLIKYLSPAWDEKTQAQTNAGEIFLKVWPKLRKEEQERLMAVFRGK